MIWLWELEKCFSTLRPIQRLAVTMTGELADCFFDRAEGVAHIVESTEVASRRLGIADVKYYSVDGRFYEEAQARKRGDSIAASNWHALANYVATTVSKDALLVDVGSTTTDVIPVRQVGDGDYQRTDFDRLQDHQLVYVGCKRTPVCALVSELDFDGRPTPVMNEFFATTDDVMLVLELVPEDPNDRDSADGKPRTISCALNRLARMIGLDHRNVTINQAKDISRQILESAQRTIQTAISKHSGPRDIVLSGHGDRLVRFNKEANVISLTDQLGAELSRCAPAYAVAWLSEFQ